MQSLIIIYEGPQDLLLLFKIHATNGKILDVKLKQQTLHTNVILNVTIKFQSECPLLSHQTFRHQFNTAGIRKYSRTLL
jgi:hypothetical protein